MHSHIGADLDTERAVEALTSAAELAVQLLIAPQASVRRATEVLLSEALAAVDSRRQVLVVVPWYHSRCQRRLYGDHVPCM